MCECRMLCHLMRPGRIRRLGRRGYEVLAAGGFGGPLFSARGAAGISACYGLGAFDRSDSSRDQRASSGTATVSCCEAEEVTCSKTVCRGRRKPLMSRTLLACGPRLAHANRVDRVHIQVIGAPPSTSIGPLPRAPSRRSELVATDEW